MDFKYEGFGTPGLQGTTLADFLINVEADLEIAEGDKVVYCERSFPVAELAVGLNNWMAENGEAPEEDFYFDSLSFDEPGAVVVSKVDSGWVVGSAFESGKATRAVAWAVLRVAISKFIENVRRDLAEIGLDPGIVDK